MAFFRQQFQEGLGPTPFIGQQGLFRFLGRNQHRLQGAVGGFLGFKNRQPGPIAGQVFAHLFPRGDRPLQIIRGRVKVLESIVCISQVRQGPRRTVAIAQGLRQGQGLLLNRGRSSIVPLGIVGQAQIIEGAGDRRLIVRLFRQGQAGLMGFHGRLVARGLVIQQANLGEGAGLVAQILMLLGDRQGLCKIGAGLLQVLLIGRHQAQVIQDIAFQRGRRVRSQQGQGLLIMGDRLWILTQSPITTAQVTFRDRGQQGLIRCQITTFAMGQNRIAIFTRLVVGPAQPLQGHHDRLAIATAAGPLKVFALAI